MSGAGFNAKFKDGKDADALRTIGEVAGALNIKPHVLRYWEEQFAALEPLKRSGGRRYYRAADIALVERIDRLVNCDGYTLKGAAAALESDLGGAASTPQATAAPIKAPAELVAQLKAIRSDLSAALAR